MARASSKDRTTDGQIIRRMFGCGIDASVMNKMLLEMDKKEFERLLLVALRMQFTIYLRYQLHYSRNPFVGVPWDLQTEWKDLPSLEVYLLFTCIDALAGPPKYKDFKFYVNENAGRFRLFIRGIDWVYDEYMEKYGTGNNLRKIIFGLPDSAKSWLLKNVSIYYEKAPLEIGSDPDELLKEIFRHFYRLRRLPFTHRAMSKPLYMEREIRIEESSWFMPYVGTRLKYKSGLDEATILRILTYVFVLQKLNLKISSNLVDKYFHNQIRLNSFYRFIGEVSRNSSVLESLIDLSDISGPQKNSLLIAGPPKLEFDSAMRAKKLFRLELPLESGISTFATEYIEKVKEINSSIKDFMDRYPSKKRKTNPELFLTDLSNTIQALLTSDSAQSVQTAANSPPITNLWGVVRNPCYS